MDGRRFKFVLENYKDGLKDTSEALDSVYRKAGISRMAPAFKHLSRYAVPAAAVAASLLIALVIYGIRQNSWTEYRADASKAVVSLPDGSAVTLARGANMKIQARKDPRHVELEGDAFFEVFHDGSHPFTVSAGNGNITVLGTKFLVSQGDDMTTVDVTEGKVMFSASGQSGQAGGIILTKGMSASVRAGNTEPEPVNEGRLNPQAWATGMFVYEKASLGDALQELSSFYGVSLTVEPVTARSLTFNGKFSTESLEDIIYSIGSALGVDIKKR